MRLGGANDMNTLCWGDTNGKDQQKQISDLFCFGPQLKIICRYIARYYVKKWYVRLWCVKDISPLSWGEGQNRIDPEFRERSFRKKTLFDNCELEQDFGQFRHNSSRCNANLNSFFAIMCSLHLEFKFIKIPKLV